jgi:hypothetical protein
MIRWEEILDYEIEDVNPRDYPDFVDAHMGSGMHVSGRELTDDELDFINDTFKDIICELAHDMCF